MLICVLPDLWHEDKRGFEKVLLHETTVNRDEKILNFSFNFDNYYYIIKMCLK